MAKQTSLFLPAGYATAGTTILPADVTNWKVVYTATANDAVIKSVGCVSNDTAAINIRIGVDVGGVVYPIGAINVPPGAGTNGVTNAVDLLNASAFPNLPVDRNGKRCLPLKAGNILKVAALTTVTAAKTLTVFATAEEY